MYAGLNRVVCKLGCLVQHIIIANTLLVFTSLNQTYGLNHHKDFKGVETNCLFECGWIYAKWKLNHVMPKKETHASFVEYGRIVAVEVASSCL